MTIEPAIPPVVSSDLMTALDAELANLPDKYRDAVVLCELDGRSLKEAAESDGVPVGTLASRLARGRQMLADRLKAKGFAVTAAAVSGALAASGASAAPVFDPAAPAVGSVPLANGVMKMALLSKLKLTTALTGVLLATGVFGVGLLPGPAPGPAAHAAPVPKDDGKLTAEQKSELDALCGKMFSPKAVSTEAAFLLAKHPNATAYLKQRLKPIKLGEKEARALIAKLFSDEAEEAAAAEQELYRLPPILAIPLPAVWAEAKTGEQRRRLAYVLVGRLKGMERDDYDLKQQGDGSFTFVVTPANVPGVPATVGNVAVVVEHRVSAIENRKDWQMALRGIYVLEHIGSPEAVKVLEAMAGGHPDAPPTVAAKEALGRLKKK